MDQTSRRRRSIFANLGPKTLFATLAILCFGSFAEATLIETSVTNVGGNTELVDDGITGRLVDPSDPEQLSAAIVDLLSNPQQAMDEARAGRQRIVGRYDVDAMTRRFESFYQDLCSVQSREHTALVASSQQN